MTAQPSQTRICNAALILLGSSARIGAITEGTPLARMFADAWDDARDAVLSDHPWNFALARQALPASADAVLAGRQYRAAFELPADCLRWLPWREDHPDHFEGEQEGRFILSNAAAPIVARFIRRVTDVALFSPGFSTALAGKLAAMTAKGITGQTGMADRMEARYERELSRGKRQDGLATGERRRTAEVRSSWLAAREGRGG